MGALSNVLIQSTLSTGSYLNNRLVCHTSTDYTTIKSAYSVWKSAQTSQFIFCTVISSNLSLPDLYHQLSEAGSLSGVVGPAAGHEGVEGRRAVVWLGQPDSLFQLVYYVSVLEPEKWLLPTTHYLPHAHS